MSGGMTLFLADPPRKCGSCTLCCTVIPVLELKKPKGVRCEHLRFGKGCTIYADRPRSCRQWSCRWLMQPELLPGGWLRPDHSHVIFDPSPDYLTMVNNETGERHDVDCQQLWVDTHHPDAHRDPRVRRVIETIAERHGIPTIARIGEPAIGIFAPCLSADREWHETDAGPDHKRNEVMRHLEKLFVEQQREIEL